MSTIGNKKCFLIDLDGTIYNGDNPIIYARDFIEKLNNKGLDYYFITNNAHESSRSISKKLENMGIISTEKNIISCVDATIEYLLENHRNDKIHLVSNNFLSNILKEKGFNLTSDDPDIVLVGFDDELNFEKMSLALRHVLNGALLICTGRDGSIPSTNGILPYTGSICQAIATAGNVEPIYMGKPDKYIFNTILGKINQNLSECLMIGDRLDTDIDFGKSNGMDTCLVLTGITNIDMIKKSNIIPSLICEDLNELMNQLNL